MASGAKSSPCSTRTSRAGGQAAPPAPTGDRRGVENPRSQDHLAARSRRKAGRPGGGARGPHRADPRAEDGHLERGGAAHRPRDQKSADPDPADRRAAAAALPARATPSSATPSSRGWPPSSARWRSLKTMVDEFSRFARMPRPQRASSRWTSSSPSWCGCTATSSRGSRSRPRWAKAPTWCRSTPSSSRRS